MKPRPESARLTTEDQLIWNRLCQRGRFRDAIIAERRDADLMFELIDLRSCGAYFNVRQLQIMAGQDGCGWVGRAYKWAGWPVAL
jgi:hypothetical protein